MVNGASDDDDDDEEIGDDTWDDEIPPPMLPHTKASKSTYDYAPVNITDNIIENAEGNGITDTPFLENADKENEITDSPFLGTRGVSMILRLNTRRNTINSITKDSKFVEDLEAKIEG